MLTQDGNQRLHNEWTFTKYDPLNRPILTGIHDTTAVLTQSQMQGVVNTHFAKGSAEWYETSGGTVHGYTNKSYPLVDDVNKYLTVTYYDNYDFPHAAGYPFVPELAHAQAFTTVKGQVTGTKTKVLDGSNQWLESVTYYDNKYRVIQNIMQNHIGGIERVTNSYDFVGKVLSSLQTHGDGTTILKEYVYDHAGRVVDTYHTINGGARILLSHNAYNELGELIDKKLHSTDNVNFAQSIDYRYNIRGWLTHINDIGIQDGEIDYFGMNLGYNEDIGLNVPSEDLQLNGNISAVRWKGDHSGTAESGYGYRYDPVNRIKAAQYYNSSVASAAFKVSGISYDQNGNIQMLNRNDHSGMAMDDLVYAYKGNRLDSVRDVNGTDGGFKDGNTGLLDYDYDANGNMILDLNKGITHIEYNHLNLPSRVEKDANNYIEYIYDAAGVKLAQIVHEEGKPVKTTDYIGAFIYKREDAGTRALQLIQHEEGRIVPDPVTQNLVYQYHLKDHLGNVRTTFTTAPRKMEFNLFYELEHESVEIGGETIDDDTHLLSAYDSANIILNNVFDHTDAHPAAVYQYAYVLNGNDSSRAGSVLTLPVGAGDRINASVNVKLFNITETAVTSPMGIGGILYNAITAGAGAGGETVTSSISSGYGSGSLLGTSTEFPVDANEQMVFLNMLFIPDNGLTAITGSELKYKQVANADNVWESLSLPEFPPRNPVM